MTPMEAWGIVSANLATLYRIRRTQNPGFKGFDDVEIEAEIMAFHALKEMQEREKQNR